MLTKVQHVSRACWEGGRGNGKGGGENRYKGRGRRKRKEESIKRKSKVSAGGQNFLNGERKQCHYAMNISKQYSSYLILDIYQTNSPCPIKKWIKEQTFGLIFNLILEVYQIAVAYRKKSRLILMLTEILRLPDYPHLNILVCLNENFQFHFMDRMKF